MIKKKMFKDETSSFGPNCDNNSTINKYRSPRRFIGSTNNIITKQQNPHKSNNGGNPKIVGSGVGGGATHLSYSTSISSPKSTTYVTTNGNLNNNLAMSGISSCGGASSVNGSNNLDRMFSCSTTNTSQFGSSKFSDDLMESRFLNKLCEDIEVSLNVDCDCADDYSINDFSGDYSFDNELKSPIGMATATSMGGVNSTTNNMNGKIGIANKNLKAASVAPSSNTTYNNKSTPQQQSFLTNGLATKRGVVKQQQQSENRNNSPTKSQLGVLV